MGGRAWQNRGLATRAARLVKAFAFDRLQLPVLTARHMPDNHASGRVMAKLGMRYCGRRALSGQRQSQNQNQNQSEVSYWQLARSLTLAAPVERQLAPCWLTSGWWRPSCRHRSGRGRRSGWRCS